MVGDYIIRRMNHLVETGRMVTMEEGETVCEEMALKVEFAVSQVEKVVLTTDWESNMWTFLCKEDKRTCANLPPLQVNIVL